MEPYSLEINSNFVEVIGVANRYGTLMANLLWFILNIAMFVLSRSGRECEISKLFWTDWSNHWLLLKWPSVIQTLSFLLATTYTSSSIYSYIYIECKKKKTHLCKTQLYIRSLLRILYRCIILLLLCFLIEF